jgi:hypothetical protein
MYTHMRTPGIKYVIAKIERGIWGWKFDQAMAHAEWIANLSLTRSVYLNAGSERRWWKEQEYKQLLDFFVQDINEGKLCGLRIFRVENLQQRPEYATWAKEALANLKRT